MHTYNIVITAILIIVVSCSAALLVGSLLAYARRNAKPHYILVDPGMIDGVVYALADSGREKAIPVLALRGYPRVTPKYLELDDVVYEFKFTRPAFAKRWRTQVAAYIWGMC